MKKVGYTDTESELRHAILWIGMSMAKELSKTFLMLYSTSKQPDNRIKCVEDQKECKK